MKSESEVQDAIEQIATPVFNYLRRYCGDEHVAEDLSQETLLRVARALPGFDGRSSLKTWAFTIATRVAADHFRRQSRTVAQVNLIDYDDFADADPTLDQRLTIDEMNGCIREVINSLPEDYRAALVLRDLEGLSLIEVAEATECTLATAKIRIHRARRRLQDALGKACSFYNDQENVFRCEKKE